MIPSTAAEKEKNEGVAVAQSDVQTSTLRELCLNNCPQTSRDLCKEERIKVLPQNYERLSNRKGELLAKGAER